MTIKARTYLLRDAEDRFRTACVVVKLAREFGASPAEWREIAREENRFRLALVTAVRTEELMVPLMLLTLHGLYGNAGAGGAL